MNVNVERVGNFSEGADEMSNAAANVPSQLKSLRQRAGLSLDALAQKMGYARASSIQRYESPDYAGGYLKRDLVEKFAKALVGRGAPPIAAFEVWSLAGPEFADPLMSEWLRGGIASARALEINAVRRGPDVEGFTPADLARLPIRGEVAAGRWLETPALLQLSEITDFVEGLAIPPSQAEWTYGLRVRGTSLNKLAVENDILVCLDAMSGIEFAHRDLVIVERVRDQGALREVTAKRLIRRDGRFHLMPESTDPMWQNEIEIGEDVPQDDAETRFIAKVKHIIKPVG